MADLKIHVGANNVGDNYNTKWGLEVIQNNFVILSAFSTERDTGGPDPTFVKGMTSFDPNQSTTIKYYNLGKKTNTISIVLINLVDGFIVTGGNGPATDGQKQEITFSIPAGAFGGRINVYCNETSQVASGVDYVGSGTASVLGLFPRIISVKPADNGFVGVETANITANPNFIAATGGAAPLAAPAVNATTRTTLETLTFSGMNQGDILELYINELIGSQNIPDGKVSEWTIPALGEYSPYIGSYGGLTMKGRYRRSGAISDFSSNVSITQAANQLPQMTFAKFGGVAGGIFVPLDKVDITNFAAGATLKVLVGTSATVATEGTHYSQVAIANGIRVTFLTTGTLNFVQTLAGMTDSANKYILVDPLLPKPILSSYVRNVGESVTVQNPNNGFDAMLVLKNGIDATINSDYSLAVGNFTFLVAGSFTLKGQKAGFPNSVESDPVVVSVNTTLSRRQYEVTAYSLADVALANVQIGSGTSADTVTNWTDGLVIELNIANGIRPKFFLRDKTNFAKVTSAYVIN